MINLRDILKLIGWLPTLIYVVLLIYLINNGEWLGLAGVIILTAMWGGYLLYRKREFFMANLRLIESFIFGKPLDKDQWDNGELRNTKVRVIWKKKKQ